MMRRPALRAIVFGLATLSIWTHPGCSRDEEDQDFAALMNLGKAHLENRESAEAVTVLTQAVTLRPESGAALRNLARAYLIGKEAKQAGSAFDALQKALDIEPDSVAAQYLTGLALNRMERYEEALQNFEKAVQLDPVTATLRYQLGRALEHAGKRDQAHRQFLETIRLDPFHASAHYRLAAHARQRRDVDEIRRLTREFQRLIELFGRRPEHVLEACVHILPELPPPPPPLAPAPIPVHWTDDTDQVFAKTVLPTATAAAVIEVDKNGRPTLFVAHAEGNFSLLKMSLAGVFERTEVTLQTKQSPRIASRGLEAKFNCCIAGDFYIKVTQQTKTAAKHDALNDIFLIGPEGARLLERVDETTFADRTESAGLAGVRGNRATWMDYDHDGDIDLLIAGRAGLELWQNNGQFRGNATDESTQFVQFENVTEQVGITDTGPAFDVAAIELDNNVAIDFVVACGNDPTPVFVNQRAGRFAPLPEPPGPWPRAHRVVVNDLNNDGYHDTVLINVDHALCILGHGAGRHRFKFAGMKLSGAVLVDYDNDGWLDVCAFGSANDSVGGGAVQLWRNNAANRWTDVTATTALQAIQTPPVHDAIAADFDADGDTDLMLLTVGSQGATSRGFGKLVFLRNNGGNANRQIKINLVSVLTNPSGLGTHLEVRRHDFWATRFVNQIPIEIGVGQADKLDAIQTVWTNGVVNNEIQLSPSTQPLTFIEKVVEVGSCPFLFAWDGQRFRFVTDILGNAPLGLSLRRDVLLPADPDEFVYVGNEDNFRPRDGHYCLEVADCYREVLYLDSVRLVAIDHPPDTEIHTTDKLMPAPFPPSELWMLSNKQTPTRVMGSDGIDRTDSLRIIDGVYAPPGDPLPPPYRGMCHPLALTIDFGILDVRKPLVLALTGWLRYGSAGVNIALSQNRSLMIIPPTLEVETETQHWTPIDLVVGMPAGKTKTILCDLTNKLPPGARRLRLTTTFEIRWDRIALFERPPLPQPRVHYLAPDSAEHHWLGFPEMRARGPGHPITPDYDVLSDRPPWRTTPEGWCTRYGDVLELLVERDDKVVIANAGDAITLHFVAAALPPPVTGLTRSFYFYSVGWEKDGDYNVVDGDTVEPLPVGGADPDWRRRYNTRWVSHHAFAPAPLNR